MIFKKLNQKGDSEAFESFRMLISFVLAAAILVIIINMVNNVNEKSVQISTQKLSEGVISGVKSVGTSARIPFVISDLLLRGTIDRRSIQNISGMNKECVFFIAGAGVDKSDNGEYISIKGTKKMDVYVYCNQTSSGIVVVTNNYPEVSEDLSTDTCPTFCVFFFNERPNAALYGSEELD